MEPAKTKPTKTASGEPIVQAPGENQVLIEKDMPFSKILELDESGKNLVFDTLDFPEISRTNLAKLSKASRMAYQMDMRNASIVGTKLANGESPYEARVKVINAKDPLARTHDSMRKGQAKTLPPGMKHLNVRPDEVKELEDVGYRKAKPEEVSIAGSKVKGGAVTLQNNKGDVENVTMLVDAEDYKTHRKADIAKSEARVSQNIEATKEKMKQYAPRVTIFDQSDLTKKQ